jgi:hypothetical protein
MKKTYINPSVEVITAKTSAMICGSNLNPNAGTGTVNETAVESGTAAESRSSWFDDEE